ncbi:MAG TPA: ABC transporter ATP-binding protein [Mycobacteriales bacterium]|nr:ABC transporter ATP-binding protein [Mycobacteriales bacterium]
MTNDRTALLRVHDLTVRYSGKRRDQRASDRPAALDSFDLDLARGELVALVGESGAGKSTAGKALLGLLDHAVGDVDFDGVDVLRASRATWRRLRRRMQMIYQDPYDALDARTTVSAVLIEPLSIHRLSPRADRTAAITETLTRVGLTPAEDFAQRRIHELSGGQRQRVCIAAALMLAPDLLVADEPVSMLDVSVRVGVLDLLRRLADEGMAVLLVTHDLPTACHYSDRVIVMRGGRIVESGPTRALVESPTDPYTRDLLSAAPGKRASGGCVATAVVEAAAG